MLLTRRRFLLGLSASATGALLAACGGAPTATAPPPTAAPSTAPSAAPAATRVATSGASQAPAGAASQVRVGYVPVLVYSPMFIAIEKGYFKAQGIETVPTPFTGGSDILAQTAAGNLEVGLGGLGAAALNAIQRGLDLRIVSSQHTESPPMATPLVVAKKKFDDGTYRTVAALKGKNVAINAKGTGTEYWLQAALAKNGLAIKDVNLTALAFDQVAAALNSGALDGAMLGEPLVTLAEGQGLVQRLADDFLSNAQGTVIFYNLKWGQGSAPVADRWLAAWLRGARDLGAGGYAKDENAAIIEKYTKTPAATIKAARPPVHDPNGALNQADMKAQQEYFLGSGSLTYKDPLDLATIIDGGFASRAVGLIGKV